MSCVGRRTSSLTLRISKHRYVVIRLHGRFESPGLARHVSVLRRYLQCSTIRKTMRMIVESVSQLVRALVLPSTRKMPLRQGARRAIGPTLPARSWLGLRCSRWRPACEGLSEDRHQHTTNALATGADLDIRNELLRVGECSGKDIWMRVGEFGDGVQHQLKLAQFHRRF